MVISEGLLETPFKGYLFLYEQKHIPINDNEEKMSLRIDRIEDVVIVNSLIMERNYQTVKKMADSEGDYPKLKIVLKEEFQNSVQRLETLLEAVQSLNVQPLNESKKESLISYIGCLVDQATGIFQIIDTVQDPSLHSKFA